MPVNASVLYVETILGDILLGDDVGVVVFSSVFELSFTCCRAYSLSNFVNSDFLVLLLGVDRLYYIYRITTIVIINQTYVGQTITEGNLDVLHRT